MQDAATPATVNAEHGTLEIPAWNLPRLMERAEKMNRRATKLGKGAVDVHEVSRIDRREYVGENGLGEPIYRVTPCVVIRVEGNRPHVAGYTLAGAIDHNGRTDGSANILRAGPGATVPESFRGARPHCDHCGTVRRRKDTFVLRRHADGEHLQIGRNCLADYLGSVTSAADLLAYYTSPDALVSWYEKNDEGFGGGRSDLFALLPYLEAVAASVRVDGWTSKGYAYEHGGIATAGLAWRVLYPTKEDLKDRAHPRITPDDVDMAQKALTWIRELPEITRKDGYMANLYAACLDEAARTKSGGLVASLVGAAFPRAMAKAVEDATKEAAPDKPVSRHVGEEKARLRDVAVTVERVRGWEGTYGYTTCIAMRDASGNALVWFASGDKHDNFEEGQSYTLTGTVKRHANNKKTGEAETQMTRCKLGASA